MGRVRKKVRKTATEKSFLPGEIITNILIRLPVKSLIRCGLVCKRWRDITLARDFVDLHLKNSIPVILDTTTNNDSQLDLFVLDKWWALARTRFKINRYPFNSVDFPCESHVLFSHAGLIVLGGCPSKKPEFSILNPARSSQECVKITLCEELRKFNICAVYYHPSLNEYCTLWRIERSRPSLKEYHPSLKEYCSLWKHEKSCPFCDQPELVQYKLLNLGSKPSWKTIRKQCNYSFKDKDAKGVLINNYIYWKSEHEYKYSGRNDILQFDIISEEFMVIPCPVPMNTKCKNHQTHLLNSDGILSFILVLPRKITIWRLDDHAEQTWTSTGYTLRTNICYGFQKVGVIAVVDGILAYELDGRLFVCNLGEGTVKNYPRRTYGGNVSFRSHQMSLASLKNCKPALFINEEGKVLA